MSRREPRSGAAIKGLAVVLGVLIGLLLYIAWQDSMSPWDFPKLFESIPIWFYIAVLSIVAVFAAAFGRSSVMASRARAAAKESTTREWRASPVRPDWEAEAPAAPPPRAPKKGRVIIDFVPVARSPSPQGSSFISASTEDASVASASTRAGSAVNEWPTETVRLGKPPRDRAPRAPPTAPAPIAVTPAIPEPYLGAELESGQEPAASAPMEAPTIEVTPVNDPQAAPDTLLGRLMNWLDETSPEAVTKRRSRRSSSKKHGR